MSTDWHVCGKCDIVISIMRGFEGFKHHNSHQMSGIKKTLLIVAAIVFVSAVAAAGYFFWQYNALKSNPDTIAKEKTDTLVTKVGKLYVLPKETPTVAEISDKEKLKDQAFFNNAQNGDYLLLFTNAKQAIIYRESTNQLINVGPISISSDETKAEKQE